MEIKISVTVSPLTKKYSIINGLLDMYSTMAKLYYSIWPCYCGNTMFFGHLPWQYYSIWTWDYSNTMFLDIYCGNTIFLGM